MIVSEPSRFQSEINQNFKVVDKCFKGVVDSYHIYHDNLIISFKGFKATFTKYSMG